MPVVINDFEAVTDAAPQAPAEAQAKPEGAGDPAPEPKDVTPILRALETQALRSWAH